VSPEDAVHAIEVRRVAFGNAAEFCACVVMPELDDVLPNVPPEVCRISILEVEAVEENLRERRKT
jgi:hypothetical protein